jgi:hypothetical protein
VRLPAEIIQTDLQEAAQWWWENLLYSTGGAFYLTTRAA